MTDTLIERVKTEYAARFSTAYVLVQAPGRINLIGEHVDYNDGFVFPAAIDKYIVVAAGRSNEGFSRAVSLDLGQVCEFSLRDLQPLKDGGWRNYVLGIAAQLAQRGLQDFNLVFAGNIPPGSGLSSSAALENSIVFALNELFRLGLEKKEMALISQKAEHDFVGVKCGIMDQFASMFGKKDQFLLLDCRSLETEYFPISFEEHEILLINSNVHHELSESAYNDRRAACERVAAHMGKKALRDVTEDELNAVMGQLEAGDYRKARFVIREIDRTQQAAAALRNGNWAILGSLLYASHQGLSVEYQVSCDELDFLVEEARKEDFILGARMMGGGFGGCTINLIRKGSASDFLDRICEAYGDRFGTRFQEFVVNTSDGTQTISQ